MIRILSKRRPRERGFTLIELLIVVAIIAILAAILIPNFLQSRASASVAASKSNLRNLATALEAYQADKLAYPTDLSELVPTYIGAIAKDPCSAEPYVYSELPDGSTSPSDFRLESDPNPWVSNCKNVVPGIYYTPAGGLQNVVP